MSKKVNSTKKGIIYVMTSEIEGVVLISGMIDVADVQQLYQLFWYHIDKKPDGVAILNAYFAVEVYNTKKKLDLLYEVYKEQRLGKTQLFKVDRFTIKKLLVELGGKPVFIPSFSKLIDLQLEKMEAEA